jgi:hypothetical protein
MPYVRCPNCEAECLVISTSRPRHHRCPQCGVSLAGASQVAPAPLRVGATGEAQAPFKREPGPPPEPAG